MKIDCHFHVLGDGTSGSGCAVNLQSPKRKLQGLALTYCCGLPPFSIGRNLDEEYLSLALQLIQGSELDRAVILAQDYVYHDDGTQDEAQTLFYTPNDYVVSLAKQHKEFIPAGCIHPYRRNALEELDALHEQGVRILKYLPSVLNIDFTEKRVQPFIQKVADHRIICLIHTGGELSLPTVRPEFHNPTYLKPLLDAGCVVIAAHGGTPSHRFDTDYIQTTLAMLKEYPRLYVDNSGCNTPFRSKYLLRLLADGFKDRMIYGSDIPIPISSIWLYLRGALSRAQHQECMEQKNLLSRDIMIKSFLGFESESLTRLHTLLS